MNRRFCKFAVFLITVPAMAQMPLVPGGQPNMGQRGFYFGGISTGATYFKAKLRGAGLPDNQSFDRSDYLTTAATSVGWAAGRSRAGVSVRYSPSWFGNSNNLNFRSLNHALQIRTNAGRGRQLGAKWTLDFNVTATISNFRNALFANGGLFSASEPGSGFRDLTTALNRNVVSGEIMVGAADGGQLLDAPSSLLFGTQNANLGGYSILSYRPSQRWSVNFTGGGTRMQPLFRAAARNRNNVDDVNIPNVVPGTMGGLAGINVSYEVSPRTTFGAGVNVTRSFNRIQDSYSTSSRVIISHNFSRRIFGIGYGGIGALTPVKLTYAVRLGPRVVGGGSLGFDLGSHRLMATVTQSAADPFGIGSHSSLTNSLAWFWNPPAGNWSLYGSYGGQRLASAGATHLNGWRAVAGVTRVLGAGFYFTANYAYLSFDTVVSPYTYLIDTQAARVGITWIPGNRLSRNLAQ